MPIGVSAYVPLATKTLTATATSVTFSSISQAYRDLVLVWSGAGVATVIPAVQFNSDTGNNYNMVSAYGYAGAASSGSIANYSKVFSLNYGVQSPAIGLATFNIMDYSATDKHKSLLVRGNVASGSYPEVSMWASRWANTAAVTSIKVLDESAGSFAIGSVFTLYGIAA